MFIVITVSDQCKRVFSSVAAVSPGTGGAFLLTASGTVSEAAKVKKVEAESRNELIGRELIALREKQMGPNVSVFYKEDGGLVVEKGRGVYLIDADDRKHLDCCNNVACVGHSHPKVVKAGKRALSSIQTNSRFLHPVQQRYLTKLLRTFPPELNTVYFVNSGSEANDLALRMAKAHTRAANPDDAICLGYAYHGTTQACTDVSPYKWSQATDGENYQPSTTHVVSIPCTYRGKHRGFTAESGRAYAQEVKDICNSTGGVGAFIAESIQGCAGQIVLPPEYLQRCYEAVRWCGGVCIADEVQTGFARSGEHFWAFQAYGVVPDIVTIGKPMGNGYPVAAVICRREIAESFGKSGMEYFSTYAGNSVACSVAEAVLDVIEEENLQHHSKRVGEYIQRMFKPLMTQFEWVGDVRGMGLYQGIEFVISNKAADPQPYPLLAKFVVDYLRYENIIISRDGPDGNVIKIKPPLIFNEDHVDKLFYGVEKALKAAKESGLF